MNAAAELFSKNGLTATGVDTIIERSGVAKMTFYNTYGSKEELIAEYFTGQDEAALGLLRQFTEKPGLSPRQRLLAVFDAFEVWFTEPDFLGCPFINGYAETKGSPGSRPHRNVIRHFELLREFLLEIAREIHPRKADRLVGGMMLLMSGAIVAQEVAPQSKPLAAARDMLKSLLKEAVDG